MNDDKTSKEKFYYDGRIPDRYYFSKSFNSPYDHKRMRYMNKVFNSDTSNQVVKVKDELQIRVTSGAKQEIKALLYEDEHKIKELIIQKFTTKNNKPHKIAFNFNQDEIQKLYDFIRIARLVNIDGEEKTKIDDDILDELLITSEDKRTYFRNNPELITEIAQNEITESDIIALAYRKKQIEMFERLMTDDAFFEIKLKELNKKKESLWQWFFEKNPWIFGYGLRYIFGSSLDDKKLEQITSGYSFSQSGKRVDALMKTAGFVSSLCFIEIKTHETSLLSNSKNPYRHDCWSISSELAGAVAQVQKTVERAMKEIQTKVELKDCSGYPTGEKVFLYQPKSYVVIGNLKEFDSEKGLNESKFSSFELFRRNLTNPEIITFDELLERVRFIVQDSDQLEYYVQENVDDIPF